MNKHLCAIWVFLLPCLMQAQTNITSDITSNTVWNISGSPYIIMNSISVQNGVTLTIDPDVEVRFNGSFSITVLGELSAIGTSMDSILITSNLPTPNPLDWDTILVQDSGSDNSHFKYCRIEFGRVGVSFKNSLAKISNSLIKNCHRSGVNIDGGSPTVIDNQINNIVNEGIQISTGTPLVESNTIYDNITGIVIDCVGFY